MANEHDMTDNFEIMGSWWLPEKGDKKVPGVLKFTADKEIKLELMGSFYESIEQARESRQAQYFEIILGESKGINFTLLRSQEMDSNFSYSHNRRQGCPLISEKRISQEAPN